MNRWLVLLLAMCLALLAGCGGGGGGGSTGGTLVRLTGVVRWLPTGDAPSPQVTVQADSRSTLTNATDGSFVLNAASGATSVLVVYSTGSGTATSRFDFASATTDSDLGDLFIGPEKVRVVGRVLGSADSLPVPGALVTLGGKQATTASDGSFALVDVAYDSANITPFLSLEGRVTKDGFFASTFSPVSGASSGVVTIDDIFLSIDSGVTPPTTPYNIDGTITPSASAEGTTVQLLSGATVVRQMVVGPDHKFGFWVGAGTYTLRATHGSLAAPDATVSLPTSNSTAHQDLVLQ